MIFENGCLTPHLAHCEGGGGGMKAEPIGQNCVAERHFHVQSLEFGFCLLLYLGSRSTITTTSIDSSLVSNCARIIR